MNGARNTDQQKKEGSRQKCHLSHLLTPTKRRFARYTIANTCLSLAHKLSFNLILSQ